MRHDMNGKCDALRMFGIPDVLEIVEAINNAELRAMNVIGIYDMPVNADGFMKYEELDDATVRGETGIWSICLK